jgi:hypothetical protein
VLVTIVDCVAVSLPPSGHTCLAVERKSQGLSERVGEKTDKDNVQCSKLELVPRHHIMNPLSMTEIWQVTRLSSPFLLSRLEIEPFHQAYYLNPLDQVLQIKEIGISIPVTFISMPEYQDENWLIFLGSNLNFPVDLVLLFYLHL